MPSASYSVRISFSLKAPIHLASSTKDSLLFNTLSGALALGDIHASLLSFGSEFALGIQVLPKRFSGAS